MTFTSQGLPAEVALWYSSQSPSKTKALLSTMCPAATNVGWVPLQELSCWRDNRSYAPPASTGWSTWDFKALVPMPQGINWGVFCTTSQVHFSLCPILFSWLLTPLDSETTPPKSPYTQTSESLSEPDLIKVVMLFLFKSENWNSERLITSPRHIAKVTFWSDSPVTPSFLLQPLRAETVPL